MLKFILEFIKDDNKLIELILFLAKKLLGKELIDFVKNYWNDVKTFVIHAENNIQKGKDRFEYVFNALKVRTDILLNVKREYWIKLLIELVVAYLTTEGYINDYESKSKIEN